MLFKSLINKTLETFGRIDVLVNNAAAPYGADRVPVIELDKKNFENVINVKLYGTFLCSKYVSLQMIKQGNESIEIYKNWFLEIKSITFVKLKY